MSLKGRRGRGNSRSGYTPKVLKTDVSEIPLEIPRDRNADFEPRLAKFTGPLRPIPTLTIGRLG